MTLQDPGHILHKSRRCAWRALCAGALCAPDTPLGYPSPYLSFNVAENNYSSWPYDLNGKIFFTNNGANYVCSGTSVASYHGIKVEDEVWTAGHCVSNTSLNSPGVWDGNAEFIPAYNGTAQDSAPFGIFVVTRMATVTTFIGNGDISEDEGAMEVGTNSLGQTLGQAVGWDGFAWTTPARRTSPHSAIRPPRPTPGTSWSRTSPAPAGRIAGPAVRGSP